MRSGLLRRLARVAVGLTLVLAFTTAPLGCACSRCGPAFARCKTGCKEGGCKKGDCKGNCKKEGCKKAQAKCPEGCTKPCCKKT